MKSMTDPTALLRRVLVWDNHVCLPLRPNDFTFLPQLERYHRSGFDVVAVNAGFDGIPSETTAQLLRGFRSWLSAHAEKYLLATSISDIEQARASGRLAVVFDIEGGEALDGRLERIKEYYDAGVRWMSLVYNRNNRLGGGCQDEDSGLTDFGRAVIREMERVGMVVCCSHAGYRTAREAMELASKPVIFSHSNVRALRDHPRNISDELIRACAATGGVVGINGIGIFLGDNDNSTEAFVRQIDYAVQLVGPKHVAISLDYVLDSAELETFVRNHPETFPATHGYSSSVRMIEPERLEAIVASLLRLGYAEVEIADILGGNWARVAARVWN